MEPNVPFAHEHLGDVYISTQQLDLAEKERDILLRLKPASGEKLAQSIQKAQKVEQEAHQDEQSAVKSTDAEDAPATETLMTDEELAANQPESESEDSTPYVRNYPLPTVTSENPLGKFWQTFAALGVAAIISGWFLSLVLFFAPTLIAVSGRNKNWLVILLVNLTVFGWLIALIMALWKREPASQPVIIQSVQMESVPPPPQAIQAQVVDSASPEA